MYVLNIDVLPVSEIFKKKLSPAFKVVEIHEAKRIPNQQVVGIYCRFAKEISVSLIQRYDNLKFVACNATGINHIDQNACSNHGVKIYSLLDAMDFLSENVTSSAEHTWCLLLAAARKLKFHQSTLSHKIFDRNRNFGLQLKDKKLGIVGIGRNGLQIAKYATAFDMNIQYYDPYKNVVDYCKLYSLQTLFAESDIVVISCKLTEETRNMIDETIFCEGYSVILINTSRGEIVREDHILSSLDSGNISSYATDVICNEVNATESIIYRRSLIDDRILITPHIGGVTDDAWRITESYLADMIVKSKYFKDHCIK